MGFNEHRPPDTLGFCHPTIDRAAESRDDDGFMARAFAEGAGTTFAILGETVLLKQGDPVSARFEPGELPLPEFHREQVFLGIEAGEARFATLYDAAAADLLGATPGMALVGLRQCAMEGLLPPGDLAGLAEGKALLHWHRTHRFCATCGHASELRQSGWRRDCPSCKALHFPRTDPVVIMLAVKGERCLLGRQPRFPQGNYSCLAGFCEPGETIEDAVRREVFEEAGITTARVRYVASQPWAFPNSLMIGAIAEATSETIVMDVTEMEDVRWFSRDEARAILAGEHADVRAPASFAIARHILKAWVTGEVGF